MRIAEALHECFPLPRSITVGSQRWTLSTSALAIGAGGVVRVTLLLSGPYERFRRARVALDPDTLLAGGYDAEEAVRAIAAWLPHSDADEVLEVTPVALAAVAHFARPADDEI